MSAWTTEQVVALAPDEASVKAARGLTHPGKWATLGQNDHALWGECRGSGSQPYQVGVEASEPAFKCTCPSRKFPCKHALGLLLLVASQPNALPAGEPPAWLSEWLAKREQTAQRKVARPTDTDLDPEQQAKRAAAKDKRGAERQRKVEAGLEELERWLRDLVRQGLAHAQKQPARYWDAMAARLVDAQAPGLARWLRRDGQHSRQWRGLERAAAGAAGIIATVVGGFSTTRQPAGTAASRHSFRHRLDLAGSRFAG